MIGKENIQRLSIGKGMALLHLPPYSFSLYCARVDMQACVQVRKGYGGPMGQTRFEKRVSFTRLRYCRDSKGLRAQLDLFDPS